MKQIKRVKRELINTGGVYQAQVSYSAAELRDVWGYLTWKDPLKYRRERVKLGDCHERTSDETPLVPNWSYVKKRNLWVSRFAGVTLVIGPDLSGGTWTLYLQGEEKIGAGSLEGMKELGTKFLLLAMVEQEKR